jgi:hypothetical protein
MKLIAKIKGTDNRFNILMDDGIVKAFTCKQLKTNNKLYFKHNNERIFIDDLEKAKWNIIKFE